MSSKNITVLSLGDESAAVLGNGDAHLKRIEKESSAEILVRGDEVHIKGSEADRNYLERIFVHLRTLAAAGIEINETVLNYALAAAAEVEENVAQSLTGNIYITPRGKKIKARTLGQKRYVDLLNDNDIVFAIGPAGTGKTYLAVVQQGRSLSEAAL